MLIYYFNKYIFIFTIEFLIYIAKIFIPSFTLNPNGVLTKNTKINYNVLQCSMY